MAKREPMNDAQIERVLRALEPFDVVDFLAPREGHPNEFEVERFAVGEIESPAVAAHIDGCDECREIADAFRAALAPNVTRLADRRPRRVFSVPLAAAAASPGTGRRVGQGVEIHVTEPRGMANRRVIAIRLADRMRRPTRLLVETPTGDAIEQALPPPGGDGVIQFVRPLAGPEDLAFVELILTAPLEFEED